MMMNLLLLLLPLVAARSPLLRGEVGRGCPPFLAALATPVAAVGPRGVMVMLMLMLLTAVLVRDKRRIALTPSASSLVRWAECFSLIKRGRTPLRVEGGACRDLSVRRGGVSDPWQRSLALRDRTVAHAERTFFDLFSPSI
jgi:hypothetical protein